MNLRPLEIFEQLATVSVLFDRFSAWTDLKTARPELYSSVRAALEKRESAEKERELLELYRKFFKETDIHIDLDDYDDDFQSSTFEFVDISADKAEVDTVKEIERLEFELKREPQ